MDERKKTSGQIRVELFIIPMLALIGVWVWKNPELEGWALAPVGFLLLMMLESLFGQALYKWVRGFFGK